MLPYNVTVRSTSGSSITLRLGFKNLKSVSSTAVKYIQLILNLDARNFGDKTAIIAFSPLNKDETIHKFTIHSCLSLDPASNWRR